MRTEHMMDNSIAASNARQARIFAEAAGQQQRRQEVISGPRYEVRRDRAGASWMVYDNLTDAPAQVGDRRQIGLSRAEAEGAISHMQDQDDPTPFYRK